MHDSAYRIGELVMLTYCDLPNARILEVGSLNVNGCLRDAAAPTTHYVGLDLEEGPSVDFVMEPGAEFPVENDSFDLVMASSVFEHDPRFWETFLRMCRAARAGGHIYVNAPSNGSVHRYPMDSWRFYPDAGVALAEYARMEGLQIELVESFIGNRQNDIWNDFAAVFRKAPSSAPMNTAFVFEQYPSLNARTWQSPKILNESEDPEDMVITRRLHDSARELTERLEDREKAVNALELQVAELTGAIASLRTNAAYAQERIDSLQAQNMQKAFLLRSQEDSIRRYNQDLEWLRRLYKVLVAEESGWSAYLPPKMRKQRVARSLRLNGVFDADTYRTRYPDVAREGVDPLQHYLFHGMPEGRPLKNEA